MRLVANEQAIRAKIAFLLALVRACEAAERLVALDPQPSGSWDPSHWKKGPYQAEKYLIRQIVADYGGETPWSWLPDGPRAARAQRVLRKMFGPAEVYRGTRGRPRGRALIPARVLPLPGNSL